MPFIPDTTQSGFVPDKIKRTIPQLREDAARAQAEARITPLQRFGADISQKITSTFPGAELGRGVGTSLYGLGQATNRAFRGDFAGASEAIQSAGQENSERMGRIFGDAARSIALPASFALGGGTGPTAISRILSAGAKYGTAGAVSGAGSSLARGESGAQAIQSGVSGFGFGAAGGSLFQGLGELVTPILSKTSTVPQKAFQTVFQKRPTTPSARIGRATPESSLQATQGAVRELRKQLTQRWDSSVDEIVNEFTGVRIGVPQKILPTLENVVKTYNVDDIPVNLANMSAKEMIGLTSKINELANKPGLKISPEGVPIKNLAKQLKQLGINTFGGQGGSYAKLFQEYSTGKKVFDAANDIVSAFKTSKPLVQRTAQNRLQTIFNEDAESYLRAIVELEKSTGIDLIRGIASAKFQSGLPRFASGPGADLLTNLAKAIAFPLTSPRSAQLLARILSSSGDASIVPIIQAAISQSQK